MISQQAIARRYAKGLLLATRNDQFDQVEKELEMLTEIYNQDQKGFYRLLEDPAFSPLERKAVINRIAKSFSISEVLHHFLILLVDKGRATFLPNIHQAFTALLDEKRQRLRAKIRSATPLGAKFLEEIKTALTKMSKKEILVNTSVEPELLGGIRVEIAGMIFDGTLRAKLNTIKNKLSY
jgi:F-type H+-transporting ATPase subunit delta